MHSVTSFLVNFPGFYQGLILAVFIYKRPMFSFYTTLKWGKLLILNFHRRSHRRCFVKKDVLKHFVNFTRKGLFWSLFSIDAGLQFYEKETPTQWFCCKIWEIFKSIYFEEHLRTTATVFSRYLFSPKVPS